MAFKRRGFSINRSFAKRQPPRTADPALPCRGLGPLELANVRESIVRNAAEHRASRNRIQMARPRASSRYNLKIPTLGGSFPASELRRRTLRSGFHRTHRCRTWR